jgi:hypothetical protein
MRAFVVAVIFGVAVGVSLSPTFAQTRGTAGYIARLVPELCGALPCNVSGITFAGGEAHLSNLRQSNLVYNSKIGQIVLHNVIPPPTGGLQAQITATLSYGADPNGDCPQANSQVTISPWATSTLVCTPPPFSFYAPCRGDLYVTAVTPPQCTDVDVIVENITVEVYERGFVGDPTRRIARDGLVRGGLTPDCNSGSPGGCP